MMSQAGLGRWLKVEGCGLKVAKLIEGSVLESRLAICGWMAKVAQMIQSCGLDGGAIKNRDAGKIGTRDQGPRRPGGKTAPCPATRTGLIHCSLGDESR